jgi:CubicO group peptidase (beta-lactamase class C family)
MLDLMRHTSGLTYGGRGTSAVHALYPASSNVAGASFDAATFLDRLAAAPLLYQPGTVWDYGLSIDVIGLVVEALSGQSLGAFLQQRLFGPLGMVDTGFQVPANKVARLARPLPRDPDTGAAQTVPDRAQALRFECGGGGLASSALDYLQFAQMLLGGGILGETRILGRKTVEAMRTDRLTADIENRIVELDPNSDGYGFGLTVAVRERAGALMGSLGEFYWNGAYGTLWWADPAEDLAVVFMAQVPGEQRRRYRGLINALVYQALVA